MIQEVRGHVMGRKKLYVKLTPTSAQTIGRKVLDQDVVDRILRRKGFNKWDGVMVTIEERWNHTFRIVDIVSSTTTTPTPATPPPPTPDPIPSQAVITAMNDAILNYVRPFPSPAGLFPCIPQRDATYLIPADVAKTIEALGRMLQSDTRINIRLTGPQGTGKTSLAKAIAAKLDWNFIKIDTGAIREPADWFCSIVAENGSTKAIPSLFLQAITTPKTVVLLDEFNRTSTTNHNAIYGLLDEHGFAWSDDLQVRIDRAPQVLILATMNIEETNVGVYELDSAIKDRFPFEIRLDLLPEPILAKVIETRSGCQANVAAKLAKLAHEVEKLVGSTLLHGTGLRSLIAAGKLTVQGISWVSACGTTVASNFSHMGGADSERAIVTNLIAGLN